MEEHHTVVYRGSPKGAAKRAREDVKRMYDVAEDARLDTVQEIVENAIVDGEAVEVATIVEVTIVQ